MNHDGIELSSRSLVRCLKWVSGALFIMAFVFQSFSVSNVKEALWEGARSTWLHESQVAWKQGRQLQVSSSSDLEDSSHASCGGHDSTTFTVNGTLAWLFVCFFVCTVLDHLNLIVPITWRFPITVIMYMAGISMCCLFMEVDLYGGEIDTFVDGMRSAASLDPHAIMNTILPPLLFESASSVSWHTLRKVLPSALLLAVPGVLLNIFFTGFVVKAMVRINHESPSWPVSWLLSSILSATDPVAVVALLSALGAPKKLSTLIEGESLLNDGSAVVFYGVFMQWVIDGHSQTMAVILANFAKLALGGAAIGVAITFILHLWIHWAAFRHSMGLEVSIFLVAVYGTFFLAEILHTSGVLAVVTLGFGVNWDVEARLSHEGRHAHHTVLKQIAYACNQVAFFAGGFVTYRFIVSDSGCDHEHSNGVAWIELGGLYFGIHVTRTAVLICLSPFLTKLGYGINWKEGCVIIYGGLRGAIGLILGLLVEHEDEIDGNVSQMVAFHTSGIVLLTLLINGSTVDGLYSRLQPYPKNPFAVTHSRKVLGKLEKECQRGVNNLASDSFFSRCEWKTILRCVPHFGSIGFDLSGMPVPDAIDEVIDVLELLSQRADDTLRYLEEPQHIKMVSDFCNVIWQKRKRESEESFVELIEDRHDCEEGRDQMLHVAHAGERVIEFVACSKHQAGHYVSSRSLQALVPAGDPLRFHVVLDRVDAVTMTVGLLAGGHMKLKELLKGSSGETRMLGFVANSVGLNCDTGRIEYNLPPAERKVAESPAGEYEPEPIMAGSTIIVTVERSFGCLEVSFHVQFPSMLDAPRALLGRCAFGFFSPKEVYPSVEFHDLTPAKNVHYRADAKSSVMALPGVVKVEDLAEDAFEAAHELAEDAMEVCADLINGVGAFFHMAHHHEKDGSPDLSPGSSLKRSFRRRHARDGHDKEPVGCRVDSVSSVSSDDGGAHDSDADDSSVESPDHSAKHTDFHHPNMDDVMSERSRRLFGMPISPESSLMLDGDSSVELVAHTSKSCHEDRFGCGSEGTSRSRKAWHPTGTWTSFIARSVRVELSFEPQVASDSESVGEIFQMMFNHVLHRYHDLHEHGLLSSLALHWLVEAVEDGVDCANREVNAVTAMDFRGSRARTAMFYNNIFSGLWGRAIQQANPRVRTSQTFCGEESASPVTSKFVGLLKGSGSKSRTKVSLVEPIIVEYLSLEAVLSKSCVWDWIPRRWRPTRLGYTSTRAKVEAVWAFVEAHEKTLAEACLIDRFPSLEQCVRRVLNEARKDLCTLEELQPRRCYFAKHLLALRLLLNGRLQSLQKYAASGWISVGDSSGLCEALWDRIKKVDLSFPRDSRTPPANKLDNAWDDFELPERGRRESTNSRTSGH